MGLNRVLLALCIGALWGGGFSAWGAPIKMEMSSQTVGIKVRRTKGSEPVLPKPLSVKVTSSELEWDYIAGTAISVPYLSFSLQGVPAERNLTLLVARTAKLTPNKAGVYQLRIPIMRKENSLSITIIDPKGAFEDWEIMVTIGLAETAVYVDETCATYAIKIKELRRTEEPNLIYVGCKIGTTVKDMSLDILWPDIERIEYMGKSFVPQNTVVTLALDNKSALDSQIVGVKSASLKSIYTLQFTPYSPPPFEIWAGLAYMYSNFRQTNFGSIYNGHGMAAMGQFWFRPEDIPLSVQFRGFGTLFNFADDLNPPDPSLNEFVTTYFANLELRYKVLDWKGWRLDPMLGGWFYFMNVRSRQFGLQRIINPVLGLVVNRKLFKRDFLELSFRFVPLQEFVNPFDFSGDKSYWEWELNYVYPFALRHRVHASFIFGYLDYNPGFEDFARTQGMYFVIGAGYGL